MKHIPFFVFTRQPDLIKDKTFEKAVGKFYIKDEDGQRLLIEDLKNEVEKSSRFKIKNLYDNALSILYSMNFDAGESVLDILEKMHYPDKNPVFKPSLYFNPLRQILEYNFRAANKYLIIPHECFDKKGDPNLSQCCHYLSGNDATYAGVRYGEYRGKDDYDKVLPKHIELMMRMILDVGNINSHSTKLNDAELQELERYLSLNVSNSRYLLFSLALNACEITLWFHQYINSHQDVETNKMRCKYLDGLKEGTAKGNNVRNDDSGVVEYDDGNYHLGKKYLLNKELIETRKWLGKRVKVIISISNSDAKTKDHYPFYAKKIDIIPD